MRVSKQCALRGPASLLFASRYGVTNRSRLQSVKSTKPDSRVTFLLRLVAVILDRGAARCFRGGAVALNLRSMKTIIFSSSLIIALLLTGLFPANAQVNVTQEHNHPSRDGLYIDSAFTPANAALLTRDLNFDGTISGHVYAQPLYIDGGPNGPMVIAVTESNNVYALHADTGLPIWSRTDIGQPASTGACPGNISPVGITGTPVSIWARDHSSLMP